MGISVNKLEEVYEKLLAIVKRETDVIGELEELSSNNIRSIETFDKVLRNALDYYKNKAPVDELSELSDEELEKQFQE